MRAIIWAGKFTNSRKEYKWHIINCMVNDIILRILYFFKMSTDKFTSLRWSYSVNQYHEISVRQSNGVYQITKRI